MAPSQDSVSLADAWWPVPVSGSPPALSRSSMTGPSRLLPMRVPLGVSWSRPLAFDPPSNPASTDTDLGDLPIHNQAIQGVQKPLEDITDSPDIAAAEPSIQLKEYHSIPSGTNLIYQKNTASCLFSNEELLCL